MLLAVEFFYQMSVWRSHRRITALQWTLIFYPVKDSCSIATPAGRLRRVQDDPYKAGLRNYSVVTQSQSEVHIEEPRAAELGPENCPLLAFKMSGSAFIDWGLAGANPGVFNVWAFECRDLWRHDHVCRFIRCYG